MWIRSPLPTRTAAIPPPPTKAPPAATRSSNEAGLAALCTLEKMRGCDPATDVAISLAEASRFIIMTSLADILDQIEDATEAMRSESRQ